MIFPTLPRANSEMKICNPPSPSTLYWTNRVYDCSLRRQWKVCFTGRLLQVQCLADAFLKGKRLEQGIEHTNAWATTSMEGYIFLILYPYP